MISKRFFVLVKIKPIQRIGYAFTHLLEKNMWVFAETQLIILKRTEKIQSLSAKFTYFL